MQDERRDLDGRQDLLHALDQREHLVYALERHEAVRVVDGRRHIAETAPRLGDKFAAAYLARRQRRDAALLGDVDGRRHRDDALHCLFLSLLRRQQQGEQAAHRMACDKDVFA